MFNNNGYSLADIAAATGNGNNGGFGFGNGDGGWILLLFILILASGGWNNGGYGNYGGGDVQRGFDQSAIINNLAGITTAVSNGFANAEVSRCNMNTNILQAINNSQAASAAGFNNVTAGLADVKYTVATENCADRNLLQQTTRDVMENCNSNYQKLMDKMCQLELDGIKQNYEAQLRAKDQTIAQQQSDLQTARFLASQGQQTGQILADNAAQTVALEQYLNPTAKPAYIVPNPNCCSQPVYYSGCGCGSRMIG
jgi:hypothetical protein